VKRFEYSIASHAFDRQVQSGSGPDLECSVDSGLTLAAGAVEVPGADRADLSEVNGRQFGDVLVAVEDAVLRARDVLAEAEGLARTTSGVEVPRSWLQPFELLMDLDDPPAVAVLVDAVMVGT
jgi:hypothetical protein